MVYIRESIKQKIKLSVTILLITLAIATAGFVVLRYQVEGERKVPFEIGKIIMISSASTQPDVGGDSGEGENAGSGENADENSGQEVAENANTEADAEDYIWNEKVVQTNDLYIYLDKNNNYKGDKAIRNVHIENIKILENVKVGKIQVYMPNSLNDGLYKYTNDYLIGSSLTYRGAAADNKKALEINNQGGCICISFANMGLENYKSNEDQEVPQGGSILSKINLNSDDLKFKVSFDLVVEVQDRTYKTTVTLDMPADGVVDKKESYVVIDNFDKTVYKRIK